MSEWVSETHTSNKRKANTAKNAKAKMDFAMKDFESGALHSTTTATAAMGDAVNVQHKKPFDIADVDSNEMKLEVINCDALAANTQQSEGVTVLHLFCVLFCF